MDAATKILLLVEDDENDVFFMQRALDKANLKLPLKVVADGQEALDYLAGRKPFTDRGQNPLPHLVLLDLKLPYVNGFEVLAWIRRQSPFRDLPVIVLTSSPQERDQQEAEKLGVQAYFVKPPTREMVLGILAPLVESFVPARPSML